MTVDMIIELLSSMTTYKSIKQKSEVQTTQLIDFGETEEYRKKYLKYKQKYIELKNKMNYK